MKSEIRATCNKTCEEDVKNEDIKLCDYKQKVKNVII